MEAISVFHIFKIGVGPSSSHTMGPWRAAERFLAKARETGAYGNIRKLTIDLYGSLAKTGKGHGTDLALLMGLTGEDPETCDTTTLPQKAAAIAAAKEIRLGGPAEGARTIPFDPATDIKHNHDEALDFHSNGLRITAALDGRKKMTETYFSVGGGFVVQEKEKPEAARAVKLPFPIEKAAQLEAYCEKERATIPQIVRCNELMWRPDAETTAGLVKIWGAMRDCLHKGCMTEGTLPGGLNVVRRASTMCQKLLGGPVPVDRSVWDAVLRDQGARDFASTLKWVSAFALAVNEENAAFGRVVTAPTNGSAGVIPAVLMYDWCFGPATFRGVRRARVVDFLLTAGEIGSLFKKGATISAAMGGCQAEIGVSSAMAAAGLCQIMGGTPAQVLMAAEIAMEHHLGMTCDPVGGLVQVPCIERNTMGAIKAITAANIALDNDPRNAKVTLDGVIKTMWATAQDMKAKYKETAEGGLAELVSVSVSEC
jgi:L-serine dehydratase